MATGSDEHDVDAIVAAARRARRTGVVALDHFEVFRLMDTWLRQVLVPALDERRAGPAGRSRGAGGRVVRRGLGRPLPQRGARSAGRRGGRARSSAAAGHEPDEARRLNRIARGHPLALTLASAAARERPDLDARGGRDDARRDRADADLPRGRARSADAAGARGRLGRAPRDPAAARRDAPRVRVAGRVRPPARPCRSSTVGSDGVFLHDAVREPIASFLRATDPSRHRDYRRAAWRRLRSEVRDAARRGAVALHGGHALPDREPGRARGVLPERRPAARGRAGAAEDEAAIFAIAGAPRRAGGRRAAGGLVAGRAGDVLGRPRPRRRRCGRSSSCSTARRSCRRTRDGDPVVGGWRRHLRDHPLPRGQLALGLRRWLDVDCGEGPCPAQAACWLDAKRTYMAMRPALRRMYVTVQRRRDVPARWSSSSASGRCRSRSARAGARTPGSPRPSVSTADDYASVVLDFGPGSVDGWLAGLVAAELGLDDDARSTRARAS